MLSERAKAAKKELEALGCSVFLDNSESIVELVMVEGEKSSDACIDLLHDLGPTLNLGFIRAPVSREAIAKYRHRKQLSGLSFIGRIYTNEYCDLYEGIERLKHINLDESSITDAGVAAMGRLPAIQHLSLDGCRITGKSLVSLGPAPALAFLALQETRVGDDIVAYLKGATVLESLLLKNTNVTDALLKSIPNQSLETLGLQGTKVTDDGVATLSRLPKLEAVYLDETKITSALLPKLRLFPKLKEFHVSGTTVTEEEVEAALAEPKAKQHPPQ